jgi:hemerythrin
MIQWGKSMETGNQTIDGQHRELVDKVNGLLEAMKQGRGKEVIGDVLVFLGSYAVSHFNEEEKLMARSNYPEREAHRKIHEAFKTDFGRLVQDYDASPASSALTIEVQRRVGDWLRNHILDVDKKLGAHLAAHGLA